MMMYFGDVTDACEECTGDLSVSHEDRIHRPAAATVQGDVLDCVYYCRRHDRTWSCGWYIPALDVA